MFILLTPSNLLLFFFFFPVTPGDFIAWSQWIFNIFVRKGELKLS